MIDKSKLKELALAATPGPWDINAAGTTNYGVFTYDEVYVYSPESRKVAIAADIADPTTGAPSVANAQYIAAANPTAILELLAELESKDRILKSRDEELTRMALATTTSTEPAKEPAACNSALRAEPADYQEFTDAEIEAWQNAAVRGVLSAQGQSDYLNGEPIKLYPSDLRDLMDTAVGAAVGAREAAAAGAARQGGNTCDNERWNPSKQAAFSSWAINAFPNESSQGLISLGSAWKQGQAYALGTSPAPSAKQEPSASEATKAQAKADLMPRREAFIKFLKARSLDETETVSAWGEREFKHSHIESMWFGWYNALESDAAPSASASPAAKKDVLAKDAKRDDFNCSTVQGYIQFLAWAIWRDHYQANSPSFCIQGDPVTALSQIDNMVTGLTRKPAAPVAGSQQVPEVLRELTDAADKFMAGEVVGLRAAIDKARAFLAAAPAVPVPAEQPKLTADDVEWVTNDNAELGVKIGNQFFFLYKAGSLVYETGKHDNGSPMYWRRVFKREFGECAHPINYDDPTKIGTVSLTDSDEWQPLPAAPSLQQPKEGSQP